MPGRPRREGKDDRLLESRVAAIDGERRRAEEILHGINQGLIDLGAVAFGGNTDDVLDQLERMTGVGRYRSKTPNVANFAAGCARATAVRNERRTRQAVTHSPFFRASDAGISRFFAPGSGADGIGGRQFRRRASRAWRPAGAPGRCRAPVRSAARHSDFREPHPREFFSPASAPARRPSAEKLELLADAGVEQAMVCRFNAAFAALSAEVVHRPGAGGRIVCATSSSVTISVLVAGAPVISRCCGRLASRMALPWRRWAA